VHRMPLSRILVGARRKTVVGHGNGIAGGGQEPASEQCVLLFVTPACSSVLGSSYQRNDAYETQAPPCTKHIKGRGRGLGLSWMA
jgi:hypothetical protein